MAIDDDPFASIGAGAKTKPGVPGEDNPFGNIGAQPSAGFGASAIDVAKQIPSAVVGAAENALTFIPQATGFVGGLVEKLPGFAPSQQEAENRAKLLELTAGARKPFTRYVPEPETPAGSIARTGVETALTTAVSPFRGGLSVPRAALAGATAGTVGEAAGQATEGTAAEPYARIGGTLLAGTAATSLANRAAVKSAVTSVRKGTEAAADQGYDQFRALNLSLDPTAAGHYTTPLRTELASRGWTERTAKNVYEILDDIDKTPFTTPAQFQARYKELGSAMRKAGADSETKMAASLAQERLLGFLESPPAWVVQGGDPARGAAILKEANANWAAAQRAKNVSGRIEKAEQVASGQYSGLGLENELRRRMGILGLSPEGGGRAARGFTEAEREAFKEFGEKGAGNIRRWLTSALAGRGGIGVTGVGGILGTAGGYFFNDPVTGGAIGLGAPLAGATLAMLGNRSALSKARNLELMLLSRSPYAAATGATNVRSPVFRSGAVPSMLPPTLSTLGE